MEVADRLTPVAADIGDDPVAALSDPLGCGKPLGHVQESRPQDIVRWSQIRRRSDVLTRDDQEVRRSLRVDVAEGDNQVVLVDEAGWDVPAGDGAEETVGHGRTSLACSTSPSTASTSTVSTPPTRVAADAGATTSR